MDAGAQAENAQSDPRQGGIRWVGKLALIVSLLAAGDASADMLAGRVSVIDDDTLELHGQRIRLFGIDAPEAGQACWTASGEAWRCGSAAARDPDRYDRIVAVCEVGG